MYRKVAAENGKKVNRIEQKILMIEEVTANNWREILELRKEVKEYKNDV